MFEVVHGGVAHGEPLQRQAPLPGDLDAPQAGEVLPGERGRLGGDERRRPLGHDPAAVLTGARPHVDEVVGRTHGLLVVLDDDDGVAEVAQPQQRVDEPAVVALVEADAGFVEDVEHADERRADLGGEADALGFAARQRGRGPPQREVAHADVGQKAQPFSDLLDHPAADEALGVGHGQRLQKDERLADAHESELGDVALADRDREAGRLETGAVALLARALAHVLLDLLADEVGFGLGVAPPQVGEDAVELGLVVPPAPLVVAVAHVDAVGRALEEQVALLGRQLAPRGVGVDVVTLDDGLEGLLHPARRQAERQQGALADGERVVGHHEIGVDLLRGAEPVAGGAGAVGVVEREDARLDLGHGDAAVQAGELL